MEMLISLIGGIRTVAVMQWDQGGGGGLEDGRWLCAHDYVVAASYCLEQGWRY